MHTSAETLRIINYIITKKLQDRVGYIFGGGCKFGVGGWLGTISSKAGLPAKLNLTQPLDRKMSTNSTSMTAGLARFKLQTEFHPGAVVHTMIKSDLDAGVRKVVVKTTWKRTRSLGSGAFGVVWAEENTATGDLRAVKAVSKQHVKDLRELDAMMQLHDVSLLKIS